MFITYNGLGSGVGDAEGGRGWVFERRIISRPNHVRRIVNNA